MGWMGSGMMDDFFQRHPPTLGDAILAAKRRMMAPLDDKDAPANLNRVLLDGVASILSPSRESLEEEAREHLYLFNLIGAPMLKIAHPEPIALDAPREAEPGHKLRISGHTAEGGQGLLELV